MICSCKYIKQFLKTFITESVKKQPENWRTESFFKHLTSRRDDDLPLNHIVTAISWLQRGTTTTGHTNIRDKINFIYNTLLTDESQKRLSWVRLTFPSLQVGAACRRSHKHLDCFLTASHDSCFTPDVSVRRHHHSVFSDHNKNAKNSKTSKMSFNTDTQHEICLNNKNIEHESLKFGSSTVEEVKQLAPLLASSLCVS